MKLTREFCAEGCDGIPAAVASGADRVELCVRLDVGGLTPPADVIERAVACCAAPSCGRAPVPVMVLIRPHADSFVYTDRDVQTMCASIHTARHLGAAGVVVGALTASGAIDRAVMKTLLDAASGLQVTFHMAFDAIEPFSAQLATELPWLRAQAEQGRLHRLLTHGSPFQPGAPAVPIEANFTYLKTLVAAAGPALRVLPGGGITSANAALVAETLGVCEVHGTRVVQTGDAAKL